MSDAIKRLQAEIGRWSDRRFGDSWSDGDDAGLPSLHHLREEIDELIDRPDDLEEWADVFMLFLDAMRRRGHELETIEQATWDKLDVNRRRRWGKPDANGVVHHVAD